MSKLIPDYVFDSIYDITPEVLTGHGVRGVLVDLDGTMASHKEWGFETRRCFGRLCEEGVVVFII